MSIVTPTQLKTVVEVIKDFITGKGATSGDCLKSITLDELNELTPKADGNNGIYKVMDGTNRMLGIALVGFPNTAWGSIVYIGALNEAPGSHDTITKPVKGCYGGSLGVSIAFRSYITLAFLVGTGVKNGLSQWIVSDLSTYFSGLSPQPWSGTQSEYDAIGEKDPGRVYYIIES